MVSCNFLCKIISVLLLQFNNCNDYAIGCYISYCSFPLKKSCQQLKIAGKRAGKKVKLFTFSVFWKKKKKSFIHLPCALLLLYWSALLLCAGQGPPSLHSPPYITFLCSCWSGAKGNTIECHLSDSSESAGTADITSNMATPSGRLGHFGCLH